MADDIQAQIPTGPNGERMELRIGSKSLGFTTKDLASVLIIVVLAGLGYFMAHNVTENQRQGFAGLAQILEKMAENQQQSLDKMAGHQQALVDLVHTNRAQMQDQIGKQNQQLTEQTTQLTKEIHEQTAQLNTNRTRLEDRLEAYMEKLQQWFTVTNYNLRQAPENQLPLGVPLPPEKGR